MKVFGVPIPFTKRSSSPSVADDRWFTPNIFPFFPMSGESIQITPETATQFTAVFACVKIISETLASTPLVVYKRLNDNGKEKAADIPLAKLLRNKPNNLKTTSLELREMMMAHVLLWGNGYAQILKNLAGEPVEIHPIHPSRVKPEVFQGAVRYKVKLKNGEDTYIPGEDMFHVRGYRDSGLEGLSPIAAARKAITMGLSMESFGSNFFEGGAFPAGVLEYAQGELDQQSKDNLRESWSKLYGGKSRGKSVAVLEAGVTWKPMGIPQTDAQFLEQRKFQLEEIGRIYRVAPHLLGELTRSTNNNIEQQSQEFVTYCMLPWFKRWEEAITRDFLNSDDSEYFVEFNLDGLLRGDISTRYTSYGLARQWGILSINDVRRLENMNTIGPEGDVYLSPLNMTAAGNEMEPKEATPPPVDPPPAENVPSEPEPPPAKKKASQELAKEAFREPLRETWRRIVRKEIGSVKTAAKKLGTDGFDKWLEKFLLDQRSFVIDCLKPIVTGYAHLSEIRSDLLIDAVVSKYNAEVASSIASWREEPSKGYDRHEEDASESLTRETLEYGRAA